jgi:hypothetical protein
VCKALLRTPLPRSLLYLYFYLYFVLLYLGVYSIDEESGLGEGGCGEGGRGEGSSQEDGSREGGGRERLVERLRQLVNGPVAPPSPRTVNKTHVKGTEMSSDRSFGRPYSGSRPVASEPALGNSGGSTLRSSPSRSSTSCPSTSRSSISDSTPVLRRFEVPVGTTFEATSPTNVARLMDKMVEMGFRDVSRDKACEALEANGHDLEAAVEMILRSSC